MSEKRSGKNQENEAACADKKAILIDIISLVVSLIAVAISAYSVFTAKQTEKELIDYQLSAERLPIVTGFNCELPIQLECATNTTLTNCDIPDAIHPLQIALYNIGSGIAQNLRAEWDESSIQDACFEIIDLLKENSHVIFAKFNFSQLVSSNWSNYDYIALVDNDDDITQIKYYNGSEYIDEELVLQIVRSPYLQPLTENYVPINIPLPRVLSLLLLEMFNQGITSSVSVELEVSFQDMVGGEFEQDYIVTFTPTIEFKSDNALGGYIDISFQKADSL